MQSLEWYWNRAKAMSPEELATRLGRQLRFGVERAGILGGTVPAKLEWPPRGGIGALSLESMDATSSCSCIEAADDVRRGIYRFFGQRFDLGTPPAWNTDPSTGTSSPLTFGKTLDYRDSRVVGDAKYLWELNRHLELVSLAQAYALTNDRSYLDTLRGLLDSWIDQCPYLMGPNWCSSLELGIRLVNWHLAYCIAGGPTSPLFAGTEGEQFREKWLRSIYQHTYFIMHHLSTYSSSANNHLIGELAGVFVSCCTWPCWPVMERWKNEARMQLQREIQRQTHDDGVNKEQTTWYQQFVASLFLVAGIAGRRAGVSFEQAYWQKIAKMLEFVSAVMDVSGNVPMIGDADDGIVFALEPREKIDPFKSLLAIGAALYSDAVWRAQSKGAETAAHWLCAGLEPFGDRAQASAPPTAFRKGGYYLLGRDFGALREVRALVDAGPLGFLSIAGHGHADCLSMTLSVCGREQLIDPGTYAYHSGRQWRDYFRSTAAHNTLRVDGQDQSEIGGPFIWLRKAESAVESLENAELYDLLRASHTGYLRLPDPVRHAREIRFDKVNAAIDIVDRLTCRERHRVERFWHFAETCEVELGDDYAESNDGVVRLRLEADERDAKPELAIGSIDPISGWVSRRFGHKSPTSTVVFRSDITGDAVLRTRIRIEVS